MFHPSVSDGHDGGPSNNSKGEEFEVLQEMYSDLRMEVGEWIEFKEGNPIPDYDQYVLWAFEDGTMCWDAIDKDGSPWLYGGEFQGFTYPKATHWRKILTPAECEELFNIK